MNTTAILGTLLLSITPIFELRGAIPFGVATGLPLLTAAALAFAGNALVSPLAFLFLETFHKLFYRWTFYAKIFDRFVEKARTKVHAKVEKYGYWGIMLFVAIPLPITGAWTGTLGAWILGMSRRKTILASAIGVLISCIIVSLVVGFSISSLSLFIKH